MIEGIDSLRLVDSDPPPHLLNAALERLSCETFGLAMDWCRLRNCFIASLMLIAMVGCQSASQKQASANSPTWSISGTISPATTGSGATVILSGSSSATTTVDAFGNYSFTGLANGSYTVTPSKTGFSFSPLSQSATVSGANVTGVNFTSSSQAGIVDIYPGMDIPSVVNASPEGTTFVIHPGTYRLTQPIVPKNGDSFIGQTACAPPATSCPAILTGSRVIGPLATFNGTNYEVTGQTQQGPTNITTAQCQPGWEGCIYPEDLFFDGVPYTHLYSASLPTISTGQWWFDYTNNVIYFHDNPAGHVVETSVVPNAFGSTANNVTISQLTIKEFAAPVGSPGTVGMPGDASLMQGTNWTVKNCEILLNHGAGVRLAFGMQILNNYIHDNGDIGIGGGLGTNSTTQSTPSGIVINHNTISNSNYAHVLNGFGSGGIKISATTGGMVRGNTITNNDGAGIHFDISVQSPLVDGNTVTDNSFGGIQYEISLTSATFRNNILLRNGVNLPNESTSNAGIGSYASTGVNAYCNVVEIPGASGANGIVVGATNRGYNIYPPGEYLVSTGNYFHHNTVTWASVAAGAVGYFQADAANQPNFFANNTPPDFNTYHLSSLSAATFVYDNNNSQLNSRKTFAEYQASGADVHGTADTNYTSGFPTVTITSPADESSFTKSVTVAATASDTSGISKVEFYVDWNLQATVTTPPYNFSWTNGTTGSHTVAAMAYSSAGIRACYAVTLNNSSD